MINFEGNSYLIYRIMKKIIYALSMLFLISCHNSSSEVEAISLDGSIWGIDDKLGQAYNLYSTDNYLIIHNKLKNTEFTAVKFNNHLAVENFGIIGRGPNEVNNSGPICNFGDKIFAMQYMKGTVVEFDLTDNSSLPIISERTLNTPLNAPQISMVVMCDSNYVSTGIFPDNNRFSIYDNKAGKVTYKGLYPKGADTSLPSHILGMAYNATICINESRDKFAVGCNYADILQIYEYDRSSSSISLINESINTTPSFDIKKSKSDINFKVNNRTMWHHLKIVANNKYIFSLYSNRLQKDGTPYLQSNIIKVYDWHGTEKYNLILDRDVIKIDVSDNCIYALFENEGLGRDVIEYKLPNKLNK